MHHDTRVPYSKVGLERLAQAMNITTAALYVDPVTSSLRLRDRFTGSSVSGHPGDHGSAGFDTSAIVGLEEESE